MPRFDWASNRVGRLQTSAFRVALNLRCRPEMKPYSGPQAGFLSRREERTRNKNIDVDASESEIFEENEYTYVETGEPQ